jgi:hypothetical protein
MLKFEKGYIYIFYKSWILNLLEVEDEGLSDILVVIVLFVIIANPLTSWNLKIKIEPTYSLGASLIGKNLKTSKKWNTQGSWNETNVLTNKNTKVICFKCYNHKTMACNI